MINKPIALSLSRINNFDCPAKFYKLYVEKSIKDSFSAAGNKGIELHKSLELYVKNGTPLVHDIAHYKPYLDKLAQLPNIHLELEIAVDKNLRPKSWFDDSVWFRAKADFVSLGRKSLYVDYKTGARKDDERQLDITAFLLLYLNPEIEELTCTNWWMQDNTTHPDKKYHREHIDDYSQVFWGIVAEPQRAIQGTVPWQYKPSARACRFCPAKKQGKCDHAI